MATVNVLYPGMVCGLEAGDRVVAAIEPGEPELVIDIAECTFMDPRGMLSLATACLDALAYERAVTLVPPTNGDVANYLLRIGFRDLLAQKGVRFDGTFARRSVAHRPHPDRLLELQEITSEREVTAVGERLMDLGRRVAIPATLLSRAFAGWSETVGNALEHSGQGAAYCVAQRYRGRENVRLEIAVGDIGVGLLSTLRRRHEEIRTDQAAVRAAVREGVSRYADPHRGFGLYWAVDQITGGQHGTLELRSGSAMLRVGPGGQSVTMYGVRRDGVQVGMRLRIPD